MVITPIKQLLNNELENNTTVSIQGWIRTRRDSKAGLSFIHVHDGSCFAPIQIIAQNTLNNYAAEILKLTAGCSIKATGTLVPSQGKGQSHEIHADSIQIIGMIDNPDTYPMAAKRHTLEHLRDIAHLRPRSNTIGAITRVRHCAAQAIHQFLSKQGFYWINTPIITASDTEGAGELFTVSQLDLANIPRTDTNNVDFKEDFFGQQAFLTVSGQLNAEAYCLAMNKVYTFGPTFRAENSNTTRHLAEFWMVEPEIAFANLMDNAQLAEQLLKSVFQTVLHECPDDMQFFADRVESTCISRLESIINSNFEVMEYTQAIEELIKSKQNFVFPVSWGMDLQTEHERFLTDKLIKKPVTVINYPKEIKAFYMRANEDNETVAAMDVLAPGIGEIIGGSQREERLDYLDRRLEELKLEKSHYHWYRDLRRYGTVPHAGFGLGFERLLNYISGLSNIRDVIPFPRAPKLIKH